MEQVQFAVIGTSMISDNFIEAIDECPRARYMGSMGSSPEKSERATKEHEGVRAFSCLEDIASCDEVDAVYIATPNSLHFEQALALVNAGKHVVVEKPIASDAAKARKLFEAARVKGVVALEAMRPVHGPGIAKIRELLPRVGKLRRANLRFGKYSSRYDELLAGQHTNIFDVRLATGALMDIGIYPVEVMVALFGAPNSVKCSSVFAPADFGELTGGAIDVAGNILAQYGDALADVAYSKVTQDLLPCQIEGELGSIVFEGIEAPRSGCVHLRGKAVRNAAKATARSLGDAQEEIEFVSCDNSMVYELEDFVACVAGERDPEEFERISVVSLEVVDEARRQGGIVFPMDGEG